MSYKELKVFMIISLGAFSLIFLVPTIWTIVFWSSPLLGLNVILPLLIYGIYELVATAYLLIKYIKL